VKRFFVYIVFMCLIAAESLAQSAGKAGAYSRMGFGARGIGMGNALTAVNSGDINTYYNPALAAFSEQRTAAATFGILALDRYLNSLSYTQEVQQRAGISVGLINAGVRNIDGRDIDGEHTEDYSTIEDQFYLAFANRVDDRVSLGVTIKLLYGKLFDKVTSTTVGFDIGACIQVTDQISVGAILQDINSKYRWDTKSIYGKDGKTTEDKFPMLRRIGLAYTLPERYGIISAEFENSSERTNIIRIGAEYYFMEHFTARCGVDRWDFSNNSAGAKPSFGFSAMNSLGNWTPAVTYAFIFEPFTPHGMHIVTLSTSF
jgi:hypothetical protein